MKMRAIHDRIKAVLAYDDGYRYSEISKCENHTKHFCCYSDYFKQVTAVYSLYYKECL